VATPLALALALALPLLLALALLPLPAALLAHAVSLRAERFDLIYCPLAARQ